MLRRNPSAMASDRSVRVLYAIGLVVIGLGPSLLLGRFLDNRFVSDDFFFCTQTFRSGFLDLVTRDWGHRLGRTSGYRPVSLLSYAFDFARGGGEASAFRRTNFVLHGLVSVSVALLALSMTRSRAASILAGVFFAVHPVHHENVFWISGRTFSLAGLFYLLSLLGVLGFGATSGPPGLTRRVLSGAAALVSLFAYEGAVTLPLATFILGLARFWTQPGRVSRAARLTLPSMSAVVVYLALRWSLIAGPLADVSRLSPTGSLAPFAFLARVPRNVGAMVLRLLACGSCGRGPFYESGAFWLTVALVAVVLVHGRRHRFFWSMSGLCVAIVGTCFLPFAFYTGYSDRFVYLSSASFCIFVAILTSAVLSGSTTVRRSGPILAGLLTVATVGMWARQLAITGGHWKEAGEMASTLLDQLVETVPQPPPHAKIHVFGLPSFHKEAVVFLTYFGRAAQLRYGRPDLAIFETRDTDMNQDDRLAKAVQDRRYVLRWSRDRRTLFLVSSP